MKTISIPCNNCGAPVKPVRNQQFFSCDYCGSSLKIAPSVNIEEENLKYKIKHELNMLEKEWELARQDLIIVDSNGSEEEPNIRSAHVGSMLGLIILAFSIPFATSVEGMIIFAFGLLSSTSLFVKAFEHETKASDYKKAKSAFETAKEKLKHDLEELRIA